MPQYAKQISPSLSHLLAQIATFPCNPQRIFAIYININMSLFSLMLSSDLCVSPTVFLIILSSSSSFSSSPVCFCLLKEVKSRWRSRLQYRHGAHYDLYPIGTDIQLMLRVWGPFTMSSESCTVFGYSGASCIVWYHCAPSSHTPSAHAPSTYSLLCTFIMPAPTPSTTYHNIMACVITTPIYTWAQMILTEVGSELLG